MWKGVPEPASVTLSLDRTSGVSVGWNDSMRMSEHPVCRALNNQVMPPMWVNGNTSAARSRLFASRRWDMPRATAAIDASVCFAPLGSAVVPEV